MKRGGSRQTLRSCSSCCASIDRDTVAATGAESDREGQTFVAAFREGLQKLGWAEGRNIRIDYRWTGLDKELIQRFTKELVALQPDLILTQSTPATAELLRQTRTIPIVFGLVADPIGTASSRAFRDREETSLVSSLCSPRWLASGWSCSKGLRFEVPSE